MDASTLELAEAQAAKDAELMASLKQRDLAKMEEVSNRILAEVNEALPPAEQEPITITRPPMNRAERRAQVKFYAQVLAQSERQEPFVHPTIVPRSKRRRR